MTLHKDHVLNFFNSCDVQFHRLNRHKEVLPFLHNRVVLKECPLIDYCGSLNRETSQFKDLAAHSHNQGQDALILLDQDRDHAQKDMGDLNNVLTGD